MTGLPIPSPYADLHSSARHVELAAAVEGIDGYSRVNEALARCNVAFTAAATATGQTVVGVEQLTERRKCWSELRP